MQENCILRTVTRGRGKLSAVKGLVRLGRKDETLPHANVNLVG